MAFRCYYDMKQFVVIGGSSGIGGAVTQQLAQAGANVYASYYRNEKESSDTIHYFHHDAMNAALDLSFLPEAIDGIVYCPGSIVLKPFSRIQPEELAQDFQLQVTGAVRILQYLLPRLKKAGRASVVLFSTVAVQTGFPFHAVVSSSKGAVEGLTKALAAELAPSIRVNCVAPSITDTPLAGFLLNTEEKRSANALRHPLKKIGTPDEVASVVSFLLNEQSAWMTGQIIHVDGGMSTIKTGS